MAAQHDGLPDDNRGPIIAGVNIAGIVLALIATILRCFVRIHLIRAFGLDDWLMAAAAVSFACYVSFSMKGIQYGTGQHVWNLSNENEANARKWWYGCYLSYAVSMTLAKTSIAWFLLRVAVQRIHKWIIYVASVMTIVSCCTFFFACAFQCSPVSYFWDKYTQPGTCISDGVVIALAYLFSVISIISDFIFALLPAWIVSHLNIKLKTKLALIALMGLGCLASAAVVIRIPYMGGIASDDFLYETAEIAIWSAVEQSLAITAGGLATLQPLVKLIGYKLGLTTSRPALAGTSKYGCTFRMAGNISVRRSISHRTEAFTPSKLQHSESGLKLQPDTSGYSAMCYNTSQEELRAGSSGSDNKTSKDLDRITERV
ncbi:Rhodopsin domain-containing protein [Madurella fahalii]|uniref:Rhodopsin domain-containing protein n=1 Tax=Madurella fahalii TaxID=1157608 RepID=A0ABQ0GLX6_9PEZI